VVLFSPQNDIVHFFDQLCLTGWRQWPARLVYAGVAGGLAYVVVRGYQKTFDEPSPTATPLVLPILSTAF
jgi:hypothetical protein